MKNSWFTETEVFVLHEVVARLDRWAHKHVLYERGLSYGEFLVAMAVREMEQPTHGEVGDMLDMSKSLVSQRVGGLLAKGFITQRRDARNRRQVRLELTASGKEALEEIYHRLAKSASALFDVLGSSRPQFLQSLRRLHDALMATEAADAGNGTFETRTRMRDRDRSSGV